MSTKDFVATYAQGNLTPQQRAEDIRRKAVALSTLILAYANGIEEAAPDAASIVEQKHLMHAARELCDDLFLVMLLSDKRLGFHEP